MEYDTKPRVPKAKMKKIVNNYAEINKLVEEYAVLFQGYLAKIAAYEMYQIIKSDWYDNYEPSEEDYQRTEEFLNAILILQSGNGYSVGVDGRKIRTRGRLEKRTMPSHSDFHDESAVTMLSSFINDLGIWQERGDMVVEVRSPIHYIERTEEIINKDLDKYWNDFCIENNIQI